MKNWQNILLLILAVLLPVAEYYLAVSLYLEKWTLYEHSKFMVRLFTITFALFVLLSNAHLAFQKQVVLLHFTAWLLYAFVLSIEHTHWVGFCWLLISLSALLLFIDPRHLWQHAKTNKPLFYFTAIALIVQIFYWLLRHVTPVRQAVWHQFLAGPTVGIPNAILKMLGFEMLPTKGLYVLKHPDIVFHIHVACSGLEGVVFFVTIFSCMMMLDYKIVSLRKIIWGYVTGILLMLFLNLFRLTLFFIAGVSAIDAWGEERASDFILSLFHDNVGWILYALGIGLYFFLFYSRLDNAGAHDARNNRQ